MRAKISIIKREKHLDHLVKMVPYVVLAYLFHCWIILSVNPYSFVTTCLTVLGGCLGAMISAFVVYDLKHSVTFHADHLKVTFLGRDKIIFFTEICEIRVPHPDESFSTLTLCTQNKKYHFYFVDDPMQVKTFLEEELFSQKLAA